MSIQTSDLGGSRPALAVLHRVQDWPWWLQCVLLWLAVLCVLTLAGLTTTRLLPIEGGWTEGMRVPGDTVPGIWARWDSGFYVALAEEGYAARPYASAFFPLYPLLMASVSGITGWSFALSGMVIAQLSYLASVLLFYKIARLIEDRHAFAMQATVYMLLFPTSFFFFAIYAEVLSLCFGLLAVYALLRARPQYLQAGLAIALAAVTRPVGIFFDAVLVGEVLRRRDWRRGTLLSAAVGLLLSGLGVLAYVVYLNSLTGSATAIVDAQQGNWLYTWKFPVVPIVEAFLFIFDNSAYPDWFSYVMNLVDLSFTLFALVMGFIALLWALKGKFPWSLTLYMGAYLLLTLSRRGAWIPLNEMGRWVAPLFPMYLILAQLTSERPRLRWGIRAVMGLGLLILMVWYASGRWVG